MLMRIKWDTIYNNQKKIENLTQSCGLQSCGKPAESKMHLLFPTMCYYRSWTKPGYFWNRHLRAHSVIRCSALNILKVLLLVYFSQLFSFFFLLHSFHLNLNRHVATVVLAITFILHRTTTTLLSRSENFQRLLHQFPCAFSRFIPRCRRNVV